MKFADRAAVTESRFAEIRKFFLDCLRESGHGRTELYAMRRPAKPREKSEEERVREWGACPAVPVGDICVGIARAFEVARDAGAVVTSFRYCQRQILIRVQQMEESRVGMKPNDPARQA